MSNTTTMLTNNEGVQVEQTDGKCNALSMRPCYGLRKILFKRQAVRSMRQCIGARRA